MSKLWTEILKFFQIIGDYSGCHQMPERSFHIGEYIVPVCARCTGVAVGQLLACISFFLLKIRVGFVMCAVLLGVMGFDWFIQQIGLKESNNIRRVITGICGGYAVCHIYLNILVFLWRIVYAWIQINN